MAKKKKLWFKGKSKVPYEGFYEYTKSGERHLILYPTKGTAKSKSFDGPAAAKAKGWAQK